MSPGVMLPDRAGQANQKWWDTAGIDSRLATPLEPRQLLFVIGLLLAVNTVRLHRKRSRREPALHDGQESRVSPLDVAVSAALAFAALAASAYEWWRAR